MNLSLKTSVRLKLAALVAVVVSLTVLALSAASYAFARRTLRQQIHDRLSVVVSDRQKLLLNYIQQQQERVGLVTSRTRLRQALADFAVGQLTEEIFRAETRRILADARASAHGLMAIWITDLNGRVITASSDEYLGRDYSAWSEFAQGRKAVTVSLRHDDSGRDQAVLAGPVSSDQRDVIGVVMMLANAEPIMDLLSDRTGLGQTGSIRLGQRDGSKVRYLLLPEVGSSNFEIAVERVPAMAAATSGTRGFQQSRDWNGAEILAAYRPVEYQDWGIVAKIDVAEAYAPVAWLRRLLLAVAIVVLLIGIVWSYWLARRFTRPILQMASMAEAIAGGGLHARVAVESRDEIGKLGDAFNRMTEELAHAQAILEDRVKQRTEELARVIATLRQSQEHTRQIIETAHEAFVAINTESIVTDWNKEAEQLFGWSREEIIGRRVTDTIIPPRYREAHQRGLQLYLGTGEGPVLNKRIELPAARRDGTEFLAELTIVPVRVGERVMFNAFLHDISERKRAEEALAYERQLLQSMMDQSPDRIYFKDLQSRYIRSNRARAEFYGLNDPALLNGKTDFDFFSKEHAQRAYEDERRIIATGKPVIAKEEMETWPDGHVTWASTTKAPWRDSAGNIVGTFGISRDITDLKRTENQLNNYFNLSPDLFCIADHNGYFRRLNPAWTEVLGYSEQELRAQPFLSFVHPDDRDATMAEFERLMKGARISQFENRYRCKDGSYRWLQWNTIPVPEEQLVHAVARDVSEHKRAQELLARFADALNQKNQEMQEDLKMAREIHQVFVSQGYPVFPRSATAETSTLRFNHRYLPTSALGGDFFEILQLSDTEAGVFICDVMGHGMRAALVTSIIRGLIDKYRNEAREPDRLLSEINRDLMTNLKTVSSTIFATAAYAVVDTAHRELRYANAGHPSPFLLRSGTGTLEPLEAQTLSHAPALGLVSDAIYPVARHSLAVGDALLMFTDGLYEVEGREGNQFGFDQLRQAVSQRVKLPGEELLDQLLLLARRHAVTGEFTDDVCLVEVELAGKTAG